MYHIQYLKNQANVGKYIIHGWYGMKWDEIFGGFFFLAHVGYGPQDRSLARYSPHKKKAGKFYLPAKNRPQKTAKRNGCFLKWWYPQNTPK